MKLTSIISACTVMSSVSSPTLAWRITDYDSNTLQEGGKPEHGKCFNEIKGPIFEIDDCTQGNFFRGKDCTGYFTAVFNGQAYFRIPSDRVSFRVYCSA